MNKEELFNAISRLFQDRLGLQRKGKYWFDDNGFAKLLFYVEPARFMDCFYINVGVYYTTLRGPGGKKVPTFHDWHLGANIGYIYQNKPTLVHYSISEEELNGIFGKIRDVVIPFTDNWRSKAYVKTHPDILKSPWQDRLSKETLFNFADSL